MNSQTLQTPFATGTPNAPAQLWIGSEELLITQVQEYLQSILCTKQKCNVCITCRQIFDKQHHSVMWLAPEKGYTLDQLEPIFTKITFALDVDQHFFFILQKADSLTAACANSLLKSMEEPPAGYHFILLAQRSDLMLPTIRSRCMIYNFAHEVTNQFNDLFDYFSTTHYHDPAAFLKELDQCKITERETAQLVDLLFTFWLTQFKQAVLGADAKKQKHAQRCVTLFEKALCQPIMPGSSKIFWRNLFLHMHQ